MGTELGERYRAYKFDGIGFSLDFEREGEDILNVDVSDDAHVRIYQTNGGCSEYSIDGMCYFRRPQSYLIIGGDTFLYQGLLQMSRNGRFLLHSQSNPPRLLDLELGIIQDLPHIYTFLNANAIANDGSVAVQSPVGLWKDGKLQPLQLCNTFYWSRPGYGPLFWVSPSGTHVVSQCNGLPYAIVPIMFSYELFALDLTSGLTQLIGSRTSRMRTNVSLTDHWVATNIELMNLDGGDNSWWPASFAPASVALSQNNRWMFFVDTQKGLGRVDTVTREVEFLTP
jgi:hypothetical protein